MDERIKQDILMFLIVLISCLIFVGAVETFTGGLSQTKERNLSSQQTIDSIQDIIKNGKTDITDLNPELAFYDNFFPKSLF